ncbi:MAG: transketolase family protein, partial [Vulcanimicrobiaceae bacterium]
MPNSPEVEARINAIRFLACDAVQKANSGHPGMPLGAAATAYTLWTNHLRFDPTEPAWFDRDRYVLSAGHGSAMLYALLHLYGYDVTIDDLKAFRQWGSKTPGHPEFRHTPGVEATTGPLGQGIANAVGMAIAAAHEAALYNRDGKTIVNRRIYAHCGDGDLMEGISQEAISLAGHLRLGNLTFIYDDNRVSLAGPTELTYDDNRDERFEASGWHVETIKVKYGNDVEDIDEALTRIKKITDKPTLLRVRTHIGYGSPLQDSFKAHGEPLGAENLAKTKTKLGWPVEPSFLVPDDVAAFFATLATQKIEERRAWESRTGNFAPSPMATQLPWPEFDASNGSVATRDAGGIVMNAIAAALPQLIGGSADLDPSTKTYLKDCGDFEPGHFDGRNIHFGVREHVMGAIANGIAYHGGFIPFTATFFNFLDYMKPAVRLAALAKL